MGPQLPWMAMSLEFLVEFRKRRPTNGTAVGSKRTYYKKNKPLPEIPLPGQYLELNNPKQMPTETNP